MTEKSRRLGDASPARERVYRHDNTATTDSPRPSIAQAPTSLRRITPSMLSAQTAVNFAKWCAPEACSPVRIIEHLHRLTTGVCTICSRSGSIEAMLILCGRVAGLCGRCAEYDQEMLHTLGEISLRHGHWRDMAPLARGQS
jgi:hypothetical protein